MLYLCQVKGRFHQDARFFHFATGAVLLLRRSLAQAANGRGGHDTATAAAEAEWAEATVLNSGDADNLVKGNWRVGFNVSSPIEVVSHYR